MGWILACGGGGGGGRFGLRVPVVVAGVCGAEWRARAGGRGEVCVGVDGRWVVKDGGLSGRVVRAGASEGGWRAVGVLGWLGAGSMAVSLVGGGGVPLGGCTWPGGRSSGGGAGAHGWSGAGSWCGLEAQAGCEPLAAVEAVHRGGEMLGARGWAR